MRDIFFLSFQVEEEFWEGEFIEACFEEMLQEEEEREMTFYSSLTHPDHPHQIMDCPNKVSIALVCVRLNSYWDKLPSLWELTTHQVHSQQIIMFLSACSKKKFILYSIWKYTLWIMCMNIFPSFNLEMLFSVDYWIFLLFFCNSQVFSSKLNPNAPEFIPRNMKKGKA